MSWAYIRNGLYDVVKQQCLEDRKFAKAISEMLYSSQKAIGLRFTSRLLERLIKRLHIFPMKDYNAYIIFEYITKTLVPGLWFSSFLTIYIPELWQ